jgi:hypothetical protein
LSTYGPSNIEISEAVNSLSDPTQNFERILQSSLNYLLFNQEKQEFESFTGHKELVEGELQYLMMPASSYGFGVLLFRNSSFNKTISAKLLNKQLSKLLVPSFALFGPFYSI